MNQGPCRGKVDHTPRAREVKTWEVTHQKGRPEGVGTDRLPSTILVRDIVAKKTLKGKKKKNVTAEQRMGKKRGRSFRERHWRKTK